MAKRVRITVHGVVQGVGFRPYVHGLARRFDLAGFVANDPEGVEIEVEGAEVAVAAFIKSLSGSPPPLAQIQHLSSLEIAAKDESEFAIRRSRSSGERRVMIAPDLATCPDCIKELRDPANRRYRYAFINCTQCGPRYTIICRVPYDRANTTMAEFVMCELCDAEYKDPANRRFHAEPVCCPQCGPQLELCDADGVVLACADPAAEAIRRMQAGQLVAVKGIGGFHLACDAANAEAVRRLRRNKQRDAKPFAVMVRDVETARGLCEVPPDAAEELGSRARPILLMRKRPIGLIARDIAPATANLGLMLPYSGLHHLLLDGPLAALVMTSGNISDEPIAYTNQEALERLRPLADAFLVHNRDIHIRTDDSVAQIAGKTLRFLRRSRGYAPFPVRLPSDTNGREILAVGAELNNTICVTRDRQAYLSHHLGDLDNVAAYDAFLQAVEHMQDILGVSPKTVACDFHPAYASRRYASASSLPVIPVQHHHAHVASVLAENRRTDKVIGVAFDGLGWGEDDTLWGGEFLIADMSGYARAGCLEPVSQPGGDAAARAPARMACAYLHKAFGDKAGSRAEALLPALRRNDVSLILQLVERGLHSPLTSSMGRLFDAASALLGICCANTYHAQAPMELEAAAWASPEEDGFYPAEFSSVSGRIVVMGSRIIQQLVEDFFRGTPRSVCAARFHNAVAHLVADVCGQLRQTSHISTVVLSGGVFGNAFLLERATMLLESVRFEVLSNHVVPPGDGGVSLGQAAVAAWRQACV